MLQNATLRGRLAKRQLQLAALREELKAMQTAVNLKECEVRGVLADSHSPPPPFLFTPIGGADRAVAVRRSPSDCFGVPLNASDCFGVLLILSLIAYDCV